MVKIQLAEVECGSMSNNVGVFSGQNMQQNWDSHSPMVSASGFMMGDYNRVNIRFATSVNMVDQFHPVYDHDVKLNHGELEMRDEA